MGRNSVTAVGLRGDFWAGRNVLYLDLDVGYKVCPFNEIYLVVCL